MHGNAPKTGSAPTPGSQLNATMESARAPGGPAGAALAGLSVLISADRIAARVSELGTEIARDYAGRPVRLIGVLKGAWMFLADLARALGHHDVSFDFLGVATYGLSSQSSGEVRVTKDLDRSIEGVDVLLVEDILDTGTTFSYLIENLRNHKPRSLRTVVLLDKASRRFRQVHADYVGFAIPDAFVVGYGLDYAERYRELPYVAILEHPDG
jgi:hypoxanthine phosphoribosyltransferase